MPYSRVTLDQIMAWRPCERYPEKRVRRLMAEHDLVGIPEIMGLETIPHVDRLWAAFHVELISAPELLEYGYQALVHAAQGAYELYPDVTMGRLRLQDTMAWLEHSRDQLGSSELNRLVAEMHNWPAPYSREPAQAKPIWCNLFQAAAIAKYGLARRALLDVGPREMGPIVSYALVAANIDDLLTLAARMISASMIGSQAEQAWQRASLIKFVTKP